MWSGGYLNSSVWLPDPDSGCSVSLKLTKSLDLCTDAPPSPKCTSLPKRGIIKARKTELSLFTKGGGGKKRNIRNVLVVSVPCIKFWVVPVSLVIKEQAALIGSFSCCHCGQLTLGRYLAEDGREEHTTWILTYRNVGNHWRLTLH